MKTVTAEGGRSGRPHVAVADVVALVAGFGIAAVHLRVVTQGSGLSAGWPIVWMTYVWLALTAAGPFVMLLKWASGDLRRIGIGEKLWALLGMPWLVTAFFPQAMAIDGPAPPAPIFTASLSLGLGLACAVALVTVWTTWVTVPPDRANRAFAGPWTNRLGLLLAIAWPFQCALGMVVIG